MHEALVERRRRIWERRCLHTRHRSMVFPVAEAGRLATWPGWPMDRGPGGPGQSETTPGPMIMGLVFVGGRPQALLGPDPQALASRASPLR